MAKSLNRAWTALSAGCQVISAGYPLYGALDQIIYRSFGALVDDFRSGQTRLRSENLHQLIELREQFGSIDVEAAKLLKFLLSLPEVATPRRDRLVGLVHGAATTGSVHKFAQSHDVLSIRSPFSSAELDFDITFWAEHPGSSLHFLLSERAHSLAEDFGFEALVPAGRLRGRPVWSLRRAPTVMKSAPNWSGVPVAVQMLFYPEVIREMQARLTLLFGSIDIVLSENSPWPLSPELRAQP